MSLAHLLGTTAGLWVVARVVGGVDLGAGTAPLPQLGTLISCALLVTLVRGLAAGLRLRVWLAFAGPTPAVAAALLLNGALFWASMMLAGIVGLPVTIAGYLPALCASLLAPIVSGAIADPAAWPARNGLDAV